MRSRSPARPNEKPAHLLETLPRRPLREVIFELRFRARSQASAAARGAGLGFLLGSFCEKVRAEYPQLGNLPTARLPLAHTPRLPRHQLRSPGGAHPLLQIGPGLLSLHEATGYAWSDYAARALRAVTALFEAAAGANAALDAESVLLRYVNALPLERKQSPLVRFVRERLHTSLSVDPALFEAPEEADDPASLAFHVTFPLRRASGAGTVAVSTGLADGKPALVWQLEARAEGERTPDGPAALAPWLANAHDLLVRWFVTLARGELLDSFRAED